MLRVLCSLLIVLALVPGASSLRGQTSAAPALSTELLKGLQFRNIGPAIMAGRIDDFSVVESNPATYYVATASGGVFRTTNNGTTFVPVFDDQPASSIGAVAVAPSNPSIVYVGTGEPNNRQSSSWGNGVYKSLDAGRTWRYLGLAQTYHIGRIVVHPHNPDIVYVAAAGHLWGPNRERGLFKTTDGGRTWTNTKFINEDTGFIDVAMDLQNPNTLYAASYQRRRSAFGFNGGGPGSALWKTTDGGDSWNQLRKGLPAEGDIGRIGVAVYRRAPHILYAIIEHQTQGGLYRSEDGGETWRKTTGMNLRPVYYSQVHVDPNNDLRVWVLGQPICYSEDGGKTFQLELGRKIHSDFHALWIDPANSDHMLAGTDGGIHSTYDRGRTWLFMNSVPLAQYYEIAVDMRKPYFVYGGLQDNGSWAGPSRTMWRQGISNEDWYKVGMGDGFYNAVDPTDYNIVYSEYQDGNLWRYDTRIFERRAIRPEAPEGQKYRFNWNSPLLISPHDPKTIYFGGNRLFGSKDRGDTWTLIAPDLTTNPDRDEMTIFGKIPRDQLSRSDGVTHYGAISAIAESPVKAGILWVGTDDGNLQVSRDAGRTWANVVENVSGVPKGTYVSRLEASHFSESRVYATFDGHRDDDYKNYAFRTDDFGKSWQRISANIPDGQVVRVIREHPRNENLLFLGTEFGLWASWDAGGQWSKMRNGLPTVPVSDIIIHPRDNDLIVATHGRGIWILDDCTPLNQLSQQTAAEDVHLFDIPEATEYRIYEHKTSLGDLVFTAPNPSQGAVISYYLRKKPNERDGLKITITDAAGEQVRELKAGEIVAGVNRVDWDLRYESPVEPQGGEEQGPFVLPGKYAVKISLGTASDTKAMIVREDPRIQISDADRNVWHQKVRELALLLKRTDSANLAVASLKRQLSDLEELLKNSGQAGRPAATVQKLAERTDALAKRLTRPRIWFYTPIPLAADPDPLLLRVRALYQGISSLTALPTTQQNELIGRLGKQVDSVRVEVNEISMKEVPALNKVLLDNGIGKLTAPKEIQ
jgi:photosystem II stability/assembly factor-like uncharacterized protein